MSGTQAPSIVSLAKRQAPVQAVGRLNDWLRTAVLARLSRIRHGRLTLVEAGTVRHFGAHNADVSLRATVQVNDPSFYADIAFGGSVGAGTAYIGAAWQCDDLTALIRILLRNYDVLDSMESGTALLSRPAYKLFHWLNRNTRNGSRRNIAAHYDLGNDFYRLFLDETMMYSCGIFERPEATLYEASVAKLDRICRKLDLSPHDHVVEIGSGWGGFAIHAAQHYGCRVTTTTISRQQYELAQQRIAVAGLQERITLLFEDYRNLEGKFDKLVSIEMIEAVGHQYYDTYFAKCGELLKDDGAMLIQAITIADQGYESARDSVDFIKRYIFPGSCIPSVTALLNAAARASDVRLFHHEDIGPHYATTLRRWRENFFSNLDQVRALGFSDEFIRMWEFYLCYCEGGFEERWISDVHLLLTKPRCRLEPVLPRLDARS